MPDRIASYSFIKQKIQKVLLSIRLSDFTCHKTNGFKYPLAIFKYLLLFCILYPKSENYWPYGDLF